MQHHDPPPLPRVDLGNVDPAAAQREIFIREALVGGEWETKLAFASANRKLIAQVEELEHKSRRAGGRAGLTTS